MPWGSTIEKLCSTQQLGKVNWPRLAIHQCSFSHSSCSTTLHGSWICMGHILKSSCLVVQTAKLYIGLWLCLCVCESVYVCECACVQPCPQAPFRFSDATLKCWEEPGNEAKLVCVCVHACTHVRLASSPGSSQLHRKAEKCKDKAVYVSVCVGIVDSKELLARARGLILLCKCTALDGHNLWLRNNFRWWIWFTGR